MKEGDATRVTVHARVEFDPRAVDSAAEPPKHVGQVPLDDLHDFGAHVELH
jgi:hypothetical protein